MKIEFGQERIRENENFQITLTLEHPGGHRDPPSPKFQLYLKKGSSKNFVWALHLWVGRQKEPILGMSQKMMKERIWTIKR